MIAIKKVLEKIENAGFDDMGPVVEADRGRWIIGDDAAFPVQLERLVEGDSYLLYSTAIRQTGAPVQSPLLKTMMLENLCGLNLGRYGICAGPVTLTLYQRITISTIDKMRPRTKTIKYPGKFNSNITAAKNHNLVGAVAQLKRFIRRNRMFGKTGDGRHARPPPDSNKKTFGGKLTPGNSNCMRIADNTAAGNDLNTGIFKQ